MPFLTYYWVVLFRYTIKIMTPNKSNVEVILVPPNLQKQTNYDIEKDLSTFCYKNTPLWNKFIPGTVCFPPVYSSFIQYFHDATYTWRSILCIRNYQRYRYCIFENTLNLTTVLLNPGAALRHPYIHVEPAWLWKLRNTRWIEACMFKSTVTNLCFSEQAA